MKTPQLPAPQLAARLGLTSELWLKREDLHKHGSHKGRSIPLMIDEAARGGARSFVISSSGNAARSAAMVVDNHNKSRPQDPYALTIFVGQKIPPAKLARLQQIQSSATHIHIIQTERPQQQAFLESKKDGSKLLRQSTDDTAWRGYVELANELSRIPNLAAVFLPASSGTLAQGLGEGFEQAGIHPEIHIVQTAQCHPLFDAVYAAQGLPIPAEIKTAHPVITAITDTVGHRQEAVAKTVLESGGGAYIGTAEEIQHMQKTAEQALGLSISTTSALSLVGLAQAVAAGKKWNGPVVAVITGD